MYSPCFLALNGWLGAAANEPGVLAKHRTTPYLRTGTLARWGPVDHLAGTRARTVLRVRSVLGVLPILKNTRPNAIARALISYLALVAGLVIAFVVLGEQPFPLQLVGAVVILAGVRRRAPDSVRPAEVPY